MNQQGGDMNIIITGRHLELTQENKNFIEEKVHSRFVNFESKLHNIGIVIIQEKLVIKSECTITSDFGDFFASAEEELLEVSVEHVLTKAVTEIKKKHDKIIDHK